MCFLYIIKLLQPTGLLTNSCFQHRGFHLHVHCSIREQPPSPNFILDTILTSLVFWFSSPLLIVGNKLERESEGCFSQKYTDQQEVKAERPEWGKPPRNKASSNRLQRGPHGAKANSAVHFDSPERCHRTTDVRENGHHPLQSPRKLNYVQHTI